jgi:hypothetical protein
MKHRIWNPKLAAFEVRAVPACHGAFESRLSRLVRGWRESRTNLTLSEVAVRCGYDKAHLARIEKSGYCLVCGFGVRPSREFLLAWAIVTGCVTDIDYLNSVLEAGGYAPIPGRAIDPTERRRNR